MRLRAFIGRYCGLQRSKKQADVAALLRLVIDNDQ
jgi:hypothetical protein